jgi:hypothetical protein
MLLGQRAMQAHEMRDAWERSSGRPRAKHRRAAREYRCELKLRHLNGVATLLKATPQRSLHFPVG